MYICIERDRERERERCNYSYIHMLALALISGLGICYGLRLCPSSRGLGRSLSTAAGLIAISLLMLSAGTGISMPYSTSAVHRVLVMLFIPVMPMSFLLGLRLPLLGLAAWPGRAWEEGCPVGISLHEQSRNPHVYIHSFQQFVYVHVVCRRHGCMRVGGVGRGVAQEGSVAQASRCWAIGSEMLTGESLGATISLFSPGAWRPDQQVS